MPDISAVMDVFELLIGKERGGRRLRFGSLLVGFALVISIKLYLKGEVLWHQFLT